MWRCDGSFPNKFFQFNITLLRSFETFFLHLSDELCEREIEVDGEPATVTLMDTWDVEVRCRRVRAAEAGPPAPN